MLVRFKKKEEGGVKKPRPLLSRDKDWDHTKVETPEPTRRLKAFDKKKEYIAILEYREGSRKTVIKYQKLGFKCEGDFASAAQAAYNMATMVGKAIAIDLHEIRNEQLCRVLAVFEISSFKDWQKENFVEAKNDKTKKHIDKAIKTARKDQVNPISYTTVTDIKVR